MNSGVLQFSLGLATGGFLNPLNSATGKLVGFIGTAISLGAVVEGVMGAIEKGAALEGLSARTNQSAQSLYGLEAGFKAVGLSADAVPGLIMRMQKSLSGVNETGERTENIFAQLGLNLAQLRNMSSAAQITTIAGALSKLNTNAATGAASALFGRFGAGDILQIARSMQEYQRVMNATKGDASVFGAMAHAWQEIVGDVEIFDSHIQAIWAGIASGITPELHKVMGEVNDFIANLGPAIAGAFQFGQVSTLFQDALMAALEQASYYGARVFEAMAVGLGDAIYAAMNIALTDFLPEYVNGVKNAAKLASLYLVSEGADSDKANAQKHLAGATTDKDKNFWQERIDYDNQSMVAAAQETSKILNAGGEDFHKHLLAATNDAGDAFAKGVTDVIKDWQSTADPNAPHKATDKLQTDIQNLAGAWLSKHPETADGKGDSIPPPNHYKREFTSLEKMGFVMGGSSNFMKRSEDLLSQLVNGMKTLISKTPSGTLGSVPGAGFTSLIS
jgi:hypothetical protein